MPAATRETPCCPVWARDVGVGKYELIYWDEPLAVGDQYAIVDTIGYVGLVRVIGIGELCGRLCFRTSSEGSRIARAETVGPLPT